jgi:hypothetical protein
MCRIETTTAGDLEARTQGAGDDDRAIDGKLEIELDVARITRLRIGPREDRGEPGDGEIHRDVMTIDPATAQRRHVDSKIGRSSGIGGRFDRHGTTRFKP